MIDPLILQSLKESAETAKATALACLAIVEQLHKADSESQWVNLDDAAIALGAGISVEMLRDRCIDGRFIHGTHFINTSDGKRSNYLIKVSSVRRFFETDPAKRPLPKKF